MALFRGDFSALEAPLFHGALRPRFSMALFSGYFSALEAPLFDGALRPRSSAALFHGAFSALKRRSSTAFSGRALPWRFSAATSRR